MVAASSCMCTFSSVIWHCATEKKSIQLHDSFVITLHYCIWYLEYYYTRNHKSVFLPPAEASPDEKPIAPNVSNAKITNKDGRWNKDGGSGGSSKLPIKTALTNFLSPGAGAIDKSRSSNGKSKSGSAVKTHLRKLQEQQRARMGASTPRSTTGQPLSTAVIGKPLTKDTAVQKTATSEIIKPNVYPPRKSRPEIDDEDETEGGSANGKNVGETK